MTTNRMRRIASRTFLALAYIAVSLQWLWVLTVGLPQLIETGIFDSFTESVPVEPSTSSQSMEFSPVFAIFAGIITVVFLLLTILIFIKLPKAISNTGDKIVHQTTNAIIPVITRHKKLPVKQKRYLTRRIVMALQLLLVAVPLIASFFVPPIQTITSQIITTLAVWLAGFSTICFAISWLLQPRITSQTRSHASRE